MTTNDEILKILIDMKGTVERTDERVDELTRWRVDMDKKVSDLDRTRWRWTGALSAIAAILGGVAGKLVGL